LLLLEVEAAHLEAAVLAVTDRLLQLQLRRLHTQSLSALAALPVLATQHKEQMEALRPHLAQRLLAAAVAARFQTLALTAVKAVALAVVVAVRILAAHWQLRVQELLAKVTLAVKPLRSIPHKVAEAVVALVL
jgi:hypothetical protein